MLQGSNMFAKLAAAIAIVVLITTASVIANARDFSSTDRALPDGVYDDPYYVVLDTTKGEIVLEVHPEWSPIGAAHFAKLVSAGYYDGAPWFRVIDGFVAQCGIAADPRMTARWQDINIMDEPVVQGNYRGYVSYGKSSEPNSRSTHFFINLQDNLRLDDSGFSAFAVVVEGMDVVDALYITGPNPEGTQDKLSELGNCHFAELYPEGNYICCAYLQ